MTEIHPDQTAEAPPDPGGVATTFVIALLAPMFLGASGGDIGLAHTAAVEAIRAYHPRDYPAVVAAAQIVAFGLAALDSLGRSLADDIPVSTALRLRSNANACARAAEQNRRAMRAAEATTKAAAENEAATGVDIQPDFATEPGETHISAPAAGEAPAERADPVAAPRPAAPRPEPERAWATAIAREAEQITAGLSQLPPGDRQAAAARARLLDSTARDLLVNADDALTPGMLARLTRPDPRARQPTL